MDIFSPTRGRTFMSIRFTGSGGSIKFSGTGGGMKMLPTGGKKGGPVIGAGSLTHNGTTVSWPTFAPERQDPTLEGGWTFEGTDKNGSPIYAYDTHIVANEVSSAFGPTATFSLDADAGAGQFIDAYLSKSDNFIGAAVQNVTSGVQIGSGISGLSGQLTCDLVVTDDSLPPAAVQPGDFFQLGIYSYDGVKIPDARLAFIKVYVDATGSGGGGGNGGGGDPGGGGNGGGGNGGGGDPSPEPIAVTWTAKDNTPALLSFAYSSTLTSNFLGGAPAFLATDDSLDPALIVADSTIDVSSWASSSYSASGYNYFALILDSQGNPAVVGSANSADALTTLTSNDLTNGALLAALLVINGSSFDLQNVVAGYFFMSSATYTQLTSGGGGGGNGGGGNGGGGDPGDCQITGKMSINGAEYSWTTDPATTIEYANASTPATIGDFAYSSTGNLIDQYAGAGAIYVASTPYSLSSSPGNFNASATWTRSNNGGDNGKYIKFGVIFSDGGYLNPNVSYDTSGSVGFTHAEIASYQTATYLSFVFDNLPVPMEFRVPIIA